MRTKLFSDKPRARHFKERDTLLFAAENNELKKEIEKWCSKHNKTIYYAEPNSPDLIAVPAFALVVDKNFIGEKSWNDFLDYQKEIKDESKNVFLIDKSKNSKIIKKLNETIKKM